MGKFLDKRIGIFATIVFSLFSCKMLPGSDKHAPGHHGDGPVFKFQLNPPDGAVYHYTLINESSMTMEADGRRADNQSRTITGINYAIQKDSSGNFLLDITYDTLLLYAKNGEKITEADAGKAVSSVDPLEKLLGIILKAHIRARVSPAGEIKHVDGYRELTNAVLASLSASDEYTREMAKRQWQQVAGDGIVKNSMEQLFRMFPDSTVQAGDEWKMNTKEDGPVTMRVRGTYTLAEIENNIAHIHAKGRLATDSGTTRLMGYPVAANLEGEQEGDYAASVQTGMLLNSSLKAKMKGSIAILGKEVPVTITRSVKMAGYKIK